VFKTNEIAVITQHPNGDLLFGTWGGGLVVLKTNGNWQRYDSSNSIIPTSVAGVQYEALSGIAIDPAGRIWTSVFNKGIAAMDLSGQGRFINPNISGTGNQIRSIAIDSFNQVWVGFQSGNVAILDTAGNDISSMYNSAILNILIYSIKSENKNRIWFATSSGLSRFSTDSIAKGVWIETLKGENIRDILFTPASYNSEQLVIAASYGKGLRILNRNGEIKATYTQENSGLVSNKINGLFFDTTNSFLWIATDEGISVFKTDIFSPRNNFNDYKLSYKNSEFFKFDYLPDGSEIFIYTIDGLLVKSIKAEGQRDVRWDLQNLKSARIKPGVYYYVIKSAGSASKQGKLLFK
jgi:ligand-binding sensor domain-containing protein